MSDYYETSRVYSTKNGDEIISECYCHSEIEQVRFSYSPSNSPDKFDTDKVYVGLYLLPGQEYIKQFEFVYKLHDWVPRWIMNRIYGFKEFISRSVWAWKVVTCKESYGGIEWNKATVGEVAEYLTAIYKKMDNEKVN